jgi:hypothetical protein
MRRGIYFVFAFLWLFIPTRARAEHDPWSPCTPGALRLCSIAQVEFEYRGNPANGGLLPFLLVRIPNLFGFTRASGAFATHAMKLSVPKVKSATSALPSSAAVAAEGKSDLACTAGSDCAMVTPEPATAFLLATGLAGLAGLGAVRRRRRTSPV